MELGHVAISRVQFLRSYMQNLNAQNSLQCVYLDETWIFENDLYTGLSRMIATKALKMEL
jgi:hypothetical protein